MFVSILHLNMGLCSSSHVVLTKKTLKLMWYFIILQRCFSDATWFAKGAQIVNDRTGSGSRVSSSVS